MKTDFFPYGVQYYRQPTPLPDEWEKDLKNIKDANYTHIQLRPQWKWGERIEGEYYFDDIDTLMDLAQKYDLKVIMKPMVECAPDWVFSKYNGSRVGFKGVPIPPIAHGAFYVGGWLPCFDNPHVKEGAYKFAQEIAKRYKDHPALWFYNAWNEPRSRPAGQCQCEHSKINYRNWLKEKFKTIENLNNFFGKAYTSFETIDPPCSSTDYVEMMLWKTWSTWAVSQHIKNVYDGIKSVDPDKVVMCHVGCCQTLNDPLDDATDDVANRSVVDLYGTSFPVPLEPKRNNELAIPVIIGDWLKCVDENFWIQEFYPCQEEWGKPPHPSILKRTLWQSIATGCEGWTYWQYRSERVGNESNGWAMREINGDATPRSEVCDYIGGKLKEFGHIFANSKRIDNEVAQIFHKEQDLISRLEACKKNFITDNPEGAPYLYKTALQHHHGIYSSVLVNGMDFVTWSKDFDKYKVISVVADEIITPNMANKLKRYVQNGGNLIIEFPFATRDITTWVSTERPNNGLDELLGIKEVVRYYEKHSCEYSSAKFENIPVYIEATPGPNTEVIGYWDTGKPCGFKHRYGKGMVYSLVASPSSIELGQGFQAVYLAREIFKEIGIKNVLPYGFTVYIREKDGHNIYFLFNYSDSNQEFKINTAKTTVIDKLDATVTPEGIIVNKGGFIILHD